jgi:hypothetical protein
MTKHADDPDGADPAPSGAMSAEELQIARGVGHCHDQMQKLAEQVFINAAEIGALVNVLHARGLITGDELKAEYTQLADGMATSYQEKRLGVSMDASTLDKYALPAEALPVIDCESRYPLCHAACCALRFALTAQDLEEGVVRWDLADPYRNRIGGDGYCVHLHRLSRRCAVYAQRPAVCRTYDCRHDRRIWLDFENRVINPDLFHQDANGNLTMHFAFPAEAPASEPAAPG